MKIFCGHHVGTIITTIIFVGITACLASVAIVAQQPPLQITSPLPGATVNPGQNLSVSVSSPSGTTFTNVAIIGESPIGSSTSGSASVPAQFTVVIPPNIHPGLYDLTALGITTAGQNVASSPVSIDVERPDMPLSLSSDSPSVSFETISDRIPISVLATFPDGTIVDATHSSYVTFSSSNTAIATVDSHGMVTAIASGRTYVTAAYTLGSGKVQVLLPITVKPPVGTDGGNTSNFTLSLSYGQQAAAPGGSATFSISALSFTGYAGLAVTSADTNNNSLVTATIDNVSITSSQWIPPSAPWLEQDLGTVGVPGNSGYSQGTYGVSSAGPQVNGNADGLHFLYQPLSGNGTIVARVLNVLDTQSGVGAYAGVTIRESLTANSRHAFTAFRSSPTVVSFVSRTTVGGSTSTVNSTNAPPPYWVKLVRNGSLFTGYFSPDGVTWTQVGTTQSISMATNAYIGLAVSSGNSNNNGLVTALLDNVSISPASAPAPVISSLSAAVGLPGNAVSISGTGFGATQSNSEVRLNGLSAPINSWSDTSIGITVPPGATSGPVTVAVAPSMNSSNPVTFKILPYPMQDQDVGAVGLAGTATYANGTFTISGAGPSVYGTADGMHFIYQPLTGNGTVIARVVGVTGMRSGTSGRAGVMIRESLNANSTHGYSSYSTANPPSNTTPIGIYLYRTTTGGSTSFVNSAAISTPYWFKIVRNGNVFSAYVSSNGASWTQVGGNQTINMATNVYAGIAVTINDNNNNNLITATVDSFSVQ